jgi:hypothetical protein
MRLTESNLKKVVKSQFKDLGVKASLDTKPELRRGLYRRGKLLNEGQLRKFIDQQVPVWVDYDTDHRARSGVFVVASTESESVMLEDGSCFALDFQFTGDDEAGCKDVSDDGDSISIFEAVKK